LLLEVVDQTNFAAELYQLKSANINFYVSTLNKGGRVKLGAHFGVVEKPVVPIPDFRITVLGYFDISCGFSQIALLEFEQCYW